MVISKLKNYYSGRSRERRAHLFNEYLHPSVGDRILDLGGGDGSYISKIIPYRENVYVADIDSDQLEAARKNYGFRTVQLDESGTLPFEDDYFDITLCNSVIQHVTVDKEKMYSYRTNRQFRKKAMERQKRFANEIRRISKSYFVQTPNRYFIIESCSWLPGFIIFLPRVIYMRIVDSLKYFWPKTTQPDYNLLTADEVRMLFPEAEIIREKSLLLTKSFIAVKPKLQDD